MKALSNTQITAVILAGGRSRRMHGQDKGLIRLNQKPLIQYVIDVIKDEVGVILINANRNQDYYQAFTTSPVINDDISGFQGPLAGIETAMRLAKTSYLLVLPCDSPMIQKPLLNALKTTMVEQDIDISVAHDGDRLQPTFVLLKTSLLTSLSLYLQKGNHKIDLWYQQHKMTLVNLSQHKHFFTNLNTPYDYAFFTKASSMHKVPILGFAAFSGTGKTTLITQVIKQLKQKKIRIAWVKHAHRSFEIDRPGKDSYECYHAGANQVLISSAKQFALINRYVDEPEPGLFCLLEKLDFSQLDLILVEGFKDESICKIELQRAELDKPSLFNNDKNIIAIVSNKTDIQCDQVVLDINNITEVSDFILAYATNN